MGKWLFGLSSCGHFCSYAAVCLQVGKGCRRKDESVEAFRDSVKVDQRESSGDELDQPVHCSTPGLDQNSSEIEEHLSTLHQLQWSMPQTSENICFFSLTTRSLEGFVFSVFRDRVVHPAPAHCPPNPQAHSCSQCDSFPKPQIPR